MLKKWAVVGGIVAVTGLGVGGVASAWSGPTAAQAAMPGAVGTAAPAAFTPATVAPAVTSAATGPATTGPASTSTSTPAKRHTKHGRAAALAKRLLRVSHAQWVTKDARTGSFVTHDAARGTITAVSAGSITLTVTDGTTETFLVTGSTKVRVAGTAGTHSITAVKVGDQVTVLGTGTGPMTATRVIAHAPGAKPTSSATTAANSTAATS